MARCWYAYNGIGDPLLPSSYNLSLAKPICLNGSIVCAIYAPGCGLSPSLLSASMRKYVKDGQLQLVAQPFSPFGAKKYVYMIH